MENTHKLTDHQIKTHINEVVIPGVYETLVDDYGFAADDYYGHIQDDIHEIIDGLEEVIYTYQAKRIAEAFDICPFESIDELTGEKFRSWSQIAYNVIYEGLQNEYQEQIISHF